MNYVMNGEINILHALGSAAKIALTDATTKRVALPVGADMELKAISITAVGGAVCFALGDGTVNATIDSHYLGENDTREFLIGVNTNLAAIRYTGSAASEVRVSVLKRGRTVQKEING